MTLDPATIEACAQVVEAHPVNHGTSVDAVSVAARIRALATRPPEPTPPGGLRPAREVAEEVVRVMTGKAMSGPRFAVAGWPGHSTIYVDEITAAIERDRQSRGTP